MKGSMGLAKATTLASSPGVKNEEISKDNNGSKTLIYCTLLALQYGLQPILAKKFSSPGASKNSIVIATELTKICLTAASMLKETAESRRMLFNSWTFGDYIKVAATPAALYAVQNLLMQYGYTMLDSMTVNLLNQTKTMSAAFFLYIILGNKQSPLQIFALVLLLIAAITLTNGVQFYEHLQSGKSVFEFSIASDRPVGAEKGLHLAGTTIVLGASAISGLSTALTQQALRSGRHALLFSAELALFGIFVLVVSDWFQKKQLFQQGGPFHDWTLTTMIPVIANAFGGLVVGLVTKYAGGVTKGFALIAGIIITAIADYLVDGIPLGPQHLISTILVSLSIYLHNTYKYVEKSKAKKE